jgi:hypothetical protein
MAGKKRQVITSFTMWPRPTFTNIVRTNKNFKSNLNAALLYAHYELSAIDLKKETTKYLKQLSVYVYT